MVHSASPPNRCGIAVVRAALRGQHPAFHWTGVAHGADKFVQPVVHREDADTVDMPEVLLPSMNTFLIVLIKRSSRPWQLDCGQPAHTSCMLTRSLGAIKEG